LLCNYGHAKSNVILVILQKISIILPLYYMMILKYKWTIAAAMLGATAGYAYYYFIGCSSGSCPITSSPWISTLYGAGMGLVVAMPSSKKKPTQGSDTTEG